MRSFHRLALCGLAIALPLPACAQNTGDLPLITPLPAPWMPVPAMNWAGVQPSDFSDNELDIPFLLNHFSTVANAVVETGPTRGFLNLKVNREPKDNEPYNARILESNLALSYFYGTKRPWNPYYNSPSVKARLEAMLNFWCSIQGPDGRFSEYKAGEYSLAPTNFGIRAMSQTLEILNGGGPTIDPQLLERTMGAQRKAIMSMLTQEDNIKWGHDFSNQFSGIYQSTLSYLKLRPDAEMEKALNTATLRAVAEHESPAGFMYEWGGGDSGYSNVHDNNLRLAWNYLKKAPAVKQALIGESENWHRWLSYNFLLQPGTGTYLTNAGVNTRTSNATQNGISRPMGEEVEMARAFSPSTTEWQQQIAAKRAKLAENWPHFPELVIPSPYAYDFGGFQTAFLNPDQWFPTPAQKAAAIAKLPYLASSNFVRQANDKYPYNFTFVRRPSYYAIFNAGKIRRADYQVYGLGALWNPTMGSVLQDVSHSEWTWGTKPAGAPKVRETTDLLAQETLNGQPLPTQPGTFDFAAAPVQTTYSLNGGGSKTVKFDADSITVSVAEPGQFSELFPLVQRKGDSLETAPGTLTLRRKNSTFTLKFDPAATISLGKAVDLQDDMQRVLVTVDAHDSLNYTLSFSGA